MTFVYDTVPYPGPILDLMSPARLCAAGLLHGWRGPDTATARLLEIGCGDGVNAIAFAAVNPQATAVGFDLSQAAIDRGRALAAAAGLTNVKLDVGDILTYPLDGQPFDYITCHGVLTWIPEHVRPALLDLIAARLAPGGVAYITYDALPGAAPKVALARFLRAHLTQTTDPVGMMAEVQQLVTMLDRTQSASSGLRGQIDFLLRELPNYDPNFFFHDWLAEFYDAVDFSALRTALAERNLKFGGSGACYDIGTLGLADPDAAALIDRAGPDHSERLALFDTLDGGRVFHRDLIIRSDTPPPAAADGASEVTYSFEGRMEPVETEAGPGTRYYFENDSSAVTTDPNTRAVVARLAEADRQDVSYADLLAGCGLSEPDLRIELTRLCSALAVKAHAGPQSFVRHPGEHPRAGALVRAMFARGTAAATLRGAAAVAHDNETRYCLALCDGTRTRAEIAAAMTERFGSATSVAQVDAAIDHFAQRAVFEA